METTLSAFDGVFLRLPMTGDEITTATPVTAGPAERMYPLE